jgi:hypothetical protein
MSTEALAIQSKEIQQWTSPIHIKERITAIQKLMKTVLKAGTKENDWSGDYGIVPGTKKPSLWKSGSEQILAMFQIAVEPIVEDLSTEDCYRYRVTTRLTNARTGEFLGAGIGECSTDESKYKWRRTYIKAEFEATEPHRRRIKFYQYKERGQWVDGQEMQVRQEPADLGNTVLKMAKKRSQIDATLTVTGASSMFEQDIEDLPEETQREFARQRAQNTERKDGADFPSVKCSECNAEGGHLPSCSKRNGTVNGSPKLDKDEQKQPDAKPESYLCSSCRKMIKPDGTGHTDDCEYKAKAEQDRLTSKPPNAALYSVKAVEQKTKKAKKSGEPGEPYFTLAVVNQAGQDGKLYVWHKSLFDYFSAGPYPKTMLAEISEQKTKDDRVFYNVEHLLELGGVKFVNDKPVDEEAELTADMARDGVIEQELFGSEE